MNYLGIHPQGEVKNRYSNKNRFTAYYSHSTKHHGKIVNWYEIVEDTAPQPVKITKNNIKEYHQFFTSNNYCQL